MSEKDTISEIIRAIDDPEGFTVHLHVEKKFNESAYTELKQHILDYQKDTQITLLVDKRVVSRVIFLERILGNSVGHLDNVDDRSEIALKVRSAHAEIIDLLDDLLDVEDET